jgi:hypothetical protein
MRKPHFGPVDDAIPDSFDEREDVVVLRVQHYLLERCLPLVSVLHFLLDSSCYPYLQRM